MTPRNLASLAAGALFAVGLVLSGMTDPANVLGFLDVAGAWNPALAFVMGGALLVYGVANRLITRRAAPLFAARFDLPTRTELDPALIGGAAIFGVGWGLAGFCPGPALVASGSGLRAALVFSAAMVVGMLLEHATAVSPAARRAPVPG